MMNGILYLLSLKTDSMHIVVTDVVILEGLL